MKKSKLKSVKYLYLLLLSLSAAAQVTTGALTGRVIDPSGAAIPNSPVVLEDPARAYRREADDLLTHARFVADVLRPDPFQVPLAEPAASVSDSGRSRLAASPQRP